MFIVDAFSRLQQYLWAFLHPITIIRGWLEIKIPPSVRYFLELLLVVAIIGLLAAIAIPKFADLVIKAREANIR